jgi:hypothetical protein
LGYSGLRRRHPSPSPRKQLSAVSADLEQALKMNEEGEVRHCMQEKTAKPVR